MSTGGAEQLFAAWRTFFERLAATAPVVMIFEDFHFADAGLIDFVDHVMEWSRNVPIYVVTLSRPELLEKRPNWGAGKRNFTSLYLEPLPESAMRELLAGLVPGLPAAAVKAIVERADGMPLYAVETVRMLLAEGRLALEDGVYRPVGDLASFAVPETLTALIASRLDGLAVDDRALVSDAAVLGQSFTIAGLSAVSGSPAAELEPRLRALVRRELLTLETDSRRPEHGQYAFVQALIREVAYNSLAKKDRKSRHLAAARFFESLGSDEIAGGLAGHYLAAYASAPEGAEADALAGQARIALRAAAARAIALGSDDQAVTFLTQALTVTTDPTETAELLERAGEIASSAARHDDAEAFLVRATQLDRERGDRPATARAIAALGKVQLTARRTAEAAELLEPAVVEFADLGDDPALVALHSQLARACMLTGDSRQAIEMADRALEVAEHADLDALVADTLITKGSALGDVGRLTEGIGTIETGGRLARNAGLVSIHLRAINNLAVYQGEIDPLANFEAQDEGLALARRIGLRHWVFGFSVGVGYSGFRLGEWDRAEAVLGEALADDPPDEDRLAVLSNALLIPAFRNEDIGASIAELERLLGSTSDDQLASNLHEVRGAEALGAGRLGDAYRENDRAAELNSTVNGTAHRSLAAHAALWGDDVTGAAAELTAIDAAGFRAPAVEAARIMIRAGLAAMARRDVEALGLYRDALHRWRDLHLVLDEALCAIDMVTLLDPADPDVRAAADAARQTFTRLRATPFVERIDAALERQRSTPRPEPARSGDLSSV